MHCTSPSKEKVPAWDGDRHALHANSVDEAALSSSKSRTVPLTRKLIIIIIIMQFYCICAMIHGTLAIISLETRVLKLLTKLTINFVDCRKVHCLAVKALLLFELDHIGLQRLQFPVPGRDEQRPWWKDKGTDDRPRPSRLSGAHATWPSLLVRGLQLLLDDTPLNVPVLPQYRSFQSPSAQRPWYPQLPAAGTLFRRLWQLTLKPG